MSTSALIGRRPIAFSRACIQSGDGPFFTPRTRRSANSGARCASSAAKSSVTSTGQGNTPGTASTAVTFKLTKTSRRKIARDAVHAGRIGTVGRQIDLDDGIVEFRPARVTLTDRRFVGQVDDAIVIVGEFELRAEHSMPFDSTPRMTPVPSVIFLPGM